jgi:hypothetical protein
MNRLLRRILAIAATALALPASASTLTPHYTDLWYLPSESGWGVNIIQQYDTMFVTLFVYGNDNQPHWYVASSVRTVGASKTQFTGQLYTTVGNAPTVPWSPSAHSFTAVGTISFDFTTVTSGTMTYTLNGATVTKTIQRQTWAGNILTGNYIGGLTAQGSNCRNGVNNGPILINGEVTINHANFFLPTITVVFPIGGSGVCTFTGPYSQEGRLGAITNGTWSCQIPNVTNPPTGVFTLTQVEATQNGVSGKFTGQDQNCDYSGFLGGIKDVL